MANELGGYTEATNGLSSGRASSPRCKALIESLERDILIWRDIPTQSDHMRATVPAAKP